VTPRRFNRIMTAQVETLRREELIDAALHAALVERYRFEGWNWLSLGRWLLLFGVVSVAAGIYFLATEVFKLTLEAGAVALAIAAAAAFGIAQVLARRGLTWSRRSLELFGGLLLIGLTFVLGLIFSSGSGNWPALLLIDLVVLLALTYALNNVLLLVLSMIVFFTWFGGVTGYASGWGAYWFGMNYPLRFLLAAVAIAGIGVLHRQSEEGAFAPYRGFFKVWLSAGVFFAEMALWLMSLFGNFGSIAEYSGEPAGGELFFFNLLWAGSNALLLHLGSRHGLGMLRGYAVTFLIIQAYTVFFRWIAISLGLIFSTFFAGAVTLALVVYLEKRRRSTRAEAESA
jgi:hypothetical protein